MNLDIKELEALYSFIRNLYSAQQAKCRELNKNNTYDPYEAGFTQCANVCYAAFFQFISEDIMLQICTDIQEHDNRK